jgi:hypothetical protein
LSSTKSATYVLEANSNDVNPEDGAVSEDLSQTFPEEETAKTGKLPDFVKTLGRTDYCTLGDFLDYVLDHLTGTVAETIRFARRKTSTMVSTGSSMAIALTEQNARAIAEAPQEVRQAVETLREDTEAEATSSGLAPTKTRGTRGRYETTHYMYVRGFCPLISQRRQAKRGRLVTETPVFTWKVVKFGIAQKMNDRDDKYGADDGFFYFCLDFMSKKDADHIEHSLCSILKPFCVDGRREYIKTEELCSFLGVETPTTPDGYRLLMLRLYTFALRLAHSFYPAMLDRPWPYGRAFEPQEVPSVKAQLCATSNAEGELSPEEAVSLTQLTVKEKGLELGPP